MLIQDNSDLCKCKMHFNPFKNDSDLIEQVKGHESCGGSFILIPLSLHFPLGLIRFFEFEFKFVVYFFIDFPEGLKVMASGLNIQN